MDKRNNSAGRFKEVRQALGLTQQQLADRLFLSRNYIAKIESGAKEPSVRVLTALESIRVEKDHSEHALDVTPATAPREPEERLRRECREKLEELLRATDNKLRRLGWLLEELEALRPTHWEDQDHPLSRDHQRAIRATLSEEQKKKRSA